MFLVFSAIKCAKTLKEKQNIKKPRAYPGKRGYMSALHKNFGVSLNNSSNNETILAENWTNERNYVWKSPLYLWAGYMN